MFPEPAGEENIRRSRRIAEIKIKEQFVPNTHYDDIDIPLKVSKKKDKGGKKGSTPTKKVYLQSVRKYLIMLIIFMLFRWKMSNYLMMKTKKIQFAKNSKKKREKESPIP